MAIFHLSLKIITRGAGKSAVAAAAYRSGDKLTNEYDGKSFDYARKSRIVYNEIMLPDNAPGEYAVRSALWNAVEKTEKAKNAQLAREAEVSLPVELTQEQNISFLRRYVKGQFVDKGMCADICVHDSGDGNPHAHILLTMRPFNKDGTWGDKFKKVYEYDLSEMKARHSRLSQNVKATERRLKTLGEHLGHSENYRKYGKVKKQSDGLFYKISELEKQESIFTKGKIQKAREEANSYHDKHFHDIADYNNAARYLKAHLNGHKFTDDVADNWKREKGMLTAEKNALYAEYHKLADEVKNAETIRRYAEDIMHRGGGRNQLMVKEKEQGR